MSREVNIVEAKDATELHEIGFKTDVLPAKEVAEVPFWAAVLSECWGMMLLIWIVVMVS